MLLNIDQIKYLTNYHLYWIIKIIYLKNSGCVLYIYMYLIAHAQALFFLLTQL